MKQKAKTHKAESVTVQNHRNESLGESEAISPVRISKKKTYDDISSLKQGKVALTIKYYRWGTDNHHEM